MRAQGLDDGFTLFDFKAKPPFQLDWIAPRLIDKNKRSLYLNQNVHEVLKAFWTSDPYSGKVPFGALTDAAIAAIYHGDGPIDDPDEAKRISMNFRTNLRRDLRHRYGIRELHAVIRRSRRIGGYELGKWWHPTRPTLNSSEVYMNLEEERNWG